MWGGSERGGRRRGSETEGVNEGTTKEWSYWLSWLISGPSLGHQVPLTAPLNVWPVHLLSLVSQMSSMFWEGVEAAAKAETLAVPGRKGKKGQEEEQRPTPVPLLHG